MLVLSLNFLINLSLAYERSGGEKSNISRHHHNHFVIHIHYNIMYIQSSYYEICIKFGLIIIALMQCNHRSGNTIKRVDKKIMRVESVYLSFNRANDSMRSSNLI